MYILNFIRGFCMALADSVPGVSGGTIAFILGFYDDFVNALHSLISNNKSGRIKAFKFLAKIGIGWITGFILSVLFITNIFEKNIYGRDDNTYEWTAEGISPKKDNLQNLPPEVCANWYKCFEKGGNIVIQDIEEIKDSDYYLF